MKELTFQLERLAHTNPELKPHIREVCRTLPETKPHQRKRASTDVKEVILDGNIAGMSPQLAKVINRRFREYQLDPYMGSIEFDTTEVEINVSAYFRGEEYSTEDLQELADIIVDDIGRRGFRRIEGEGYTSEISGNALLIFTQRI